MHGQTKIKYGTNQCKLILTPYAQIIVLKPFQVKWNNPCIFWHRLPIPNSIHNIPVHLEIKYEDGTNCYSLFILRAETALTETQRQFVVQSQTDSLNAGITKRWTTAELVGFIVKREASIRVRSCRSTCSSLLNAIQTSSRATQQIQGEVLTVYSRRCQDLLCFTMCLNQRWHSCAERLKQTGISSSDS